MALRSLAGWLVAAGLAYPAALVAGDRCIDNCSNIPKGAQPAPPGTYINKFIAVQAGKAETDDFVLYKHMWYRAGTELGPLGHFQLGLIARRLPSVPFPVVVETSGNAELDETRREVVIAMLRMSGFDDPSRVIVAYPIAEGLYGEEAFRVYNGILFGGYGGYGSNGSFGAGFGGFGGGYGGYGGFFGR